MEWEQGLSPDRSQGVGHGNECREVGSIEDTVRAVSSWEDGGLA